MNNENAWSEMYKKTNFGNKYPSSYLVSLLYGKILHYIPSKDRQLKVLDFGCSLGANSKMLQDAGFDVYGIDISDDVIKRCIDLNGFNPDKFVAMDILKDRIPFDCKFDLIIAGAVIYYFDIDSTKKLLNILKSILTDDGILYTNWITFNHPYYRNYINAIPDNSGMIGIEQSGAASLPLYVRILNNRDELNEIFANFNVLDILTTIEEIDGITETFHVLAKR